MLHRKSENGQALVIIAFGIVALIGLTGLAIDGGNTYANRQQSHTATESAALAGALRWVKDGPKVNDGTLTVAQRKSNAITAAENVAQTNGFDQSGAHSTVTVNIPPQAACGESSNPYIGQDNYVQVVINTTVPTYFAQVVGVSETTNCTQAIALGDSGQNGSMFGGAGIVALDPHGNALSNGGFKINSGAHVNTTNSGIFVNSDNSQGLWIENGGHLNMDLNGQLVGGYGYHNGAQWSPGLTTGATQYAIPLPEWDTIPPIPATPTCSGSNHGDINTSGTYDPGVYGNINANAVFKPGTYCISGYNSGNLSQVASPAGTVKIVTNGNISTNGNVTFSDLEVYGTGSIQANSSARFDVTRFRFYNSGSGYFLINSGARFVSSDFFIYLTSGYTRMNSGGKVDLQAPPSGDPYAGLVVYEPWTNTTTENYFNSGSGFSFTGTYLAPHTKITFNGGSSADTSNGQIVGYVLDFEGGTTDVNFDASKTWGTPKDAKVQLVYTGK